MSGTDSSSGVDTDAGAAGSSASFSLSTGGLVAIIVVVAIVVIAGGAISVLWYLAKRRQWDVRASLRRASRRMTGRGPEPGYTKQRSTRAGGDGRSRRAGVQMSAMPASSKSQARAKVVEVRDVEKGLPRQYPQQQQRQQQQRPQQLPPQQPQQQQQPTKTGRSWVDRLHVATNDGM